MIPNIAILLSILMLVVAKLNSEDCKPGTVYDDPPKARQWCHDVFTSPRVGYQAWYQGGAFLKVIDGTLTVELVPKNAKPVSLNVEGKDIVTVKKGFASISSLKWLSLEDNSIQRIDESSVFEGLPELSYLNLARNRITYLHEDTFRGLTKLAVLNLNDNGLRKGISFSVDRHTLPALRHLYLQHNLLEQIFVAQNQKTNLCDSNLQHLYLSANSIKTFSMLGQDDFASQDSCLQRLTHLFLEDNSLAEITIAKSVPLEALSLDGNNIRDIPADVPPRLKFLSLARNDIAIIRNLEGAENIEFLVLSYNMITELSSYENLQNLSSLKHLALDYNFAESIPDGFFQKLTSLRSLYLTNNNMSKISPQAFASLPELREISIMTN